MNDADRRLMPPNAGPAAGGPASDHAVYGITVAAELSGAPTQSLRLWERHGLLAPARTDGGTRRYSADDVARIGRIVALVASGVSTAALMAVGNAALISPYGVATRTALLGTGSFVDDGTITGGDVAAILTAGGVLTIVLIALTTWVLNRRDTRI